MKHVFLLLTKILLQVGLIEYQVVVLLLESIVEL